jgi:hypothetical protein
MSLSPAPQHRRALVSRADAAVLASATTGLLELLEGDPALPVHSSPLSPSRLPHFSSPFRSPALAIGQSCLLVPMPCCLLGCSDSHGISLGFRIRTYANSLFLTNLSRSVASGLGPNFIGHFDLSKADTVVYALTWPSAHIHINPFSCSTCKWQVRYEAALALRGLLEAASGPAPFDSAEALDGFRAKGTGARDAVAGVVSPRAAGALRGLLGLLEAVGNDDVSAAVRTRFAHGI